MASLNPLTRELVFKIVFYGPGLGGKTTTLQYIHAATKPEHRGKMVSLATPMDRTLYFDFLPLRIPRVRGMGVRLQLFTVPGQVYYGATRKLVLTGADGVVFVADSQPGRMEANQESLDDLVANLVEHNRPLAQLSHTFQWNKRDLADAVPLEELNRKFNPGGAPAIGTVATRGDGVFDGLEKITRLVIVAYEAELPRSERAPETRYDSSEHGGIADAIRGLAESSGRPVLTPLAPRPASLPNIDAGFVGGHVASDGRAQAEAADSADGQTSVRAPPETAAEATARGLGELPQGPDDAHDGHAHAEDRGANGPPSASFRREPSVDHDDMDQLPTVALSGPSASPGALPGALPGMMGEARPAAFAPRTSPSGFSLVDLWGEPERETAREAEIALGTRELARAVLACDMLVTRVLASAAGLLGSLDAPRDPGSVALLLGLDGRRYLGFRAIVRAVRQSEDVSGREALECYAFALEVRRAREQIGR